MGTAIGARICCDGSGGPGQSTTDPVVGGEVEDPAILGTAVGNLTGPWQSVPRAELLALVRSLEATVGQVELCTDASYVQRLFKKCRQPRFQASSHADLWLQVKAAQRARDVALHKIKAHLSFSAFKAQRDQSLWWMWAGNVEADSLASKRASEIFNKEAAEVQAWLDARTWKVQERLLEAVEWWFGHPEFGPKQVHTCKKSTKVEWFAALIDNPIMSAHAWGSHKSGLKCNSCGTKLSNHHLWGTLQDTVRSSCQGVRIVRCIETLHPSHVLENGPDGKISCKLCRCKALLCRVQSSGLMRVCRRYRRRR